MLPLKKIYIDSRDRTPDSVSSSNFKITLRISVGNLTLKYKSKICNKKLLQMW